MTPDLDPKVISFLSNMVTSYSWPQECGYRLALTLLRKLQLGAAHVEHGLLLKILHLSR